VKKREEKCQKIGLVNDTIPASADAVPFPDSSVKFILGPYGIFSLDLCFFSVNM
jgi:hypothetical protein